MGSPSEDTLELPILTHDLAQPRSAAELAREKRLRDDPMAEVHGPLFVTCKRCSGRIKLSPKSSYDPFHWMKHRERCLRKPVGVAPPTRPTPPKDGICTSLAKKSPAPSLLTDGDNATPPPLTPDDDDRAAISDGDLFRDRSLSPALDDLDLSAKPAAVRELDSAFLDYLQRSQRPLPKHALPVVERWQTWNWSELRPPVWMACDDVVSDAQTDGDDDRDDSPIDPVDMFFPLPRLTLYPSTRNQTAPSISA